MEYLPVILMGSFIISLILSLMSVYSKKSSMEIVNEMGIGYNLGNLFECDSDIEKIITPNDQITLLKNTIPTKKMITSIKKSGFKTIRFPITWTHFIDDYGNINPDWMKRIKVVVDWIIDSSMYCIINIYNDATQDNWIFQEKNAIDKYINLWKQISNEFKIYDEHLIFESMNEVEYKSPEDKDNINTILNNLNQVFVNTVRNSSGYNNDRLLLVSGSRYQRDSSLISDFKMPIDLRNKLGVSMHYFLPLDFTIETDDNSWSILDTSGYIYNSTISTTWGTQSDYNDMINNFEYLEKTYIQNGIPVILSEVAVDTEHNKDIKSIREYIYSIFSLSLDYNYITPCLWDTSNKETGNFNYYNRESLSWYDEKIKDNFIKIKKRKGIYPLEYLMKTNYENTTELDTNGYLNINIGEKKVLKISFNVKTNLSSLNNIIFVIASFDKKGDYFMIIIEGKSGKKQYDGTHTFTVDVSNKNCNYRIMLIKNSNEFIVYNYLSVEYEESFLTIDFKKYKEDILNYI